MSRVPLSVTRALSQVLPVNALNALYAISPQLYKGVAEAAGVAQPVSSPARWPCNRPARQHSFLSWEATEEICCA